MSATKLADGWYDIPNISHPLHIRMNTDGSVSRRHFVNGLEGNVMVMTSNKEDVLEGIRDYKIDPKSVARRRDDWYVQLIKFATTYRPAPKNKRLT